MAGHDINYLSKPGAVGAAYCDRPPPADTMSLDELGS
jgi:hypothetical protein